MSEEFESIHKAPKLKAGDGVRNTKYKHILSKDYPEIWSKQLLMIHSLLKHNPWTYKIEDLNGEKKVKSFYEKELLLSILSRSYCQNQIVILEIKSK